eukprot:gene9270-11901_t
MRELYPSAALKWEFDTGGDYLDGCWPAVGSDGTVYVPGFYLYALSSVGTLKWKYVTQIAIGIGSQGRPLVGVNGTGYSMCMAYLYTYLCSLSQDGKLNWRYKVDGTVYALSPVEGSDGTVYFGVYDTSVGNATVYAVLPGGTLRWKYSVLGAGDLSSSPLVFCKGNIFLAGGLNTQLYIFSPDGRVLWTYSLSGYTNPAVVAFQDVVYVNSNDVF